PEIPTTPPETTPDEDTTPPEIPTTPPETTPDEDTGTYNNYNEPTEDNNNNQNIHPEDSNVVPDDEFLAAGGEEDEYEHYEALTPEDEGIDDYYVEANNIVEDPTTPVHAVEMEKIDMKKTGLPFGLIAISLISMLIAIQRKRKP
ncbi:MAG: hypothetical protein FWE58_05800, partial [Methanobrevibacter sp.]|nr:hypothetical protein [Methanobrevibacter sp.]